ncbi:MAG TPA: YciI family protein [Solirubrobacteraceae bacterium]|nr:YciI family protein [Solirubrobacteraceae bacterium]
MQYMLIIALDENGPGPVEGEPGFDEGRQAWTDFTRELMESGVLVSGASLQPTTVATTVRVAAGSATVTDGPFAESKEQLAGYYLVDVADLDAALAWAKKIPLPAGSIEVRPVSMMPDATGTPQVVGADAVGG